MIVAQISDTHIKPANVRLFGQVDVYRHLRNLVDRLERLDPRPDLVIHTGDIVNDGTADDYEAAAACLENLSIPLLVTVGNHDRRHEARRAFRRLPDLPDEGRFAYVVDRHPLRIVMLDSLVEGTAHGQLGNEQLEWLTASLSARPDAPTLICLHHPPFETGVEHMDGIGLTDAAALEAIVQAHPQVLRVLAGHVHRLFITRFGGTIAMTCPGAAHQVAADFRPDVPARWTAEPPGFLLHRWSAADLVSVVMPVETSPGKRFTNEHTVAAP